MLNRFFARKNDLHQDASDHQLIEAFCQKDDHDALGALFNRYTHMIYLTAFKYMKDEDDSKDVVMEVFAKVMTELKTGRVRNFRNWLFIITKNHCLMILRKRKPTVELNEELLEKKINIVEFAVAQNHTDSEEMEELLRRGIGGLNEKQQLCLTLFFFENKSYKEISVQTGFDMKTVKSHIQNGKRNLKIALAKYREDYHE
jgi:RNA polymerase sigma factor (sigma-70 family)